ncbi:transmembrane protein 71 isoform X1 [Stegostoma tigrinum]|uniref:transmembrane protein 71 isoform X1 n=2 Tax=Stegostoma tigrinum TaxID=3053191 RepID=UPI00286FE8C1|nr:transmembrane protein 71 isoform X1 [Stegostoma tigrinum]XP_059502350.1 transmembrane protein 71 isoform X1 [Stegostoma tigrinum]XP_059502351.1 transmembrane protein 71 isoform X1 [Stegostoma tigrinum]XP_059502352.1 transmembrane protein 71 isoform X1 [Stegostoma tigrinum]
MFPDLQQELSTKETLQSSKLSLMTSENSCSPWYLNPLSGSPCTCRRSPRLLTNGYYDLSEESFVDEEGNLTFIPSKINISYKENLVRIFRRKKKVRRSLASLFSLDSSSSWLNNSLFSGIDCPLAESSWIDGGNDFDSSFRNDQGRSSVDASPNGKSWLSEENMPVIDTESYTKESLLINKSTGGHFKLPSHSPLHPTKCFLNNMLGGPDLMTVKSFFFHLIISVLSICVAVFASWFLAGVVAALLTTMLVFAAVLYTAKSAYPFFLKSDNILHHAQSENLKNNFISTASQQH